MAQPRQSVISNRGPVSSVRRNETTEDLSTLVTVTDDSILVSPIPYISSAKRD